MPTNQELDDSILEQLSAKEELRWKQIEHISARFGIVAALRGVLFVISIGLVFTGIRDLLGISIVWFILAGLMGVGFFVAAAVHETFERRKATLTILLRFCQNSIARFKRDWSRLATPKITAPDDRLAVAHDLDWFGESSLYQLIGTTKLPAGKNCLRDWIAYGSTPAEILERQQAVAELSKQGDWMERFQLRCELLAASPTGPAALVQWAEGKQPFKYGPLLSWIGIAGFFTAMIALILWGAGILNPFVAGSIIVAVPAINFILAVVFVGHIHEIFLSISSKHREVDHYRSIFSMVASYAPGCACLERLRKQMVSGDHDARTHLNSLGRLVWAANLRRHGILFLPYLFLQFYGLWDAQALTWLERWRRKHAHHIAGWFDALGQWEATQALALFKASHPDWTFPVVNEAGAAPELKATALGHPLLSNEDRVTNDVTVGPPGKVLLVTGSNMSGKSTLLRSIGLNVVLAQMGSVVCAKSLSMSPMWIESSMRIHDSLADGVSFFMAELKRLKQIVDTADEYEGKTTTLLYLLDEILQGTNSGERHIAVNRVIRHMIDAGAIGAVSTHDLELADAEGLESACEVVHFREQFFEENGQKRMTFDYQMRQGVAPTTNALKLLDLVGLADQSAT